MVTPRRQGGELVFSVFLNGPTPGFEETSEVHCHTPGERFSVQVHLSLVAAREAAHLVIIGKHLLEGLPAKPFLQLQ